MTKIGLSASRVHVAQAAGKYRSCLGKIGWLCQTRTARIFYSMLSCAKFLPRLLDQPLDQAFLAGDGSCLEDEGATMVAYCDSNWASEKSTQRRRAM